MSIWRKCHKHTQYCLFFHLFVHLLWCVKWISNTKSRIFHKVYMSNFLDQDGFRTSVKPHYPIIRILFIGNSTIHECFLTSWDCISTITDEVLCDKADYVRLVKAYISCRNICQFLALCFTLRITMKVYKWRHKLSSTMKFYGFVHQLIF